MVDEDYHERIAERSAETRDRHRASTPRLEKLEVIDWHNPRVDACQNPQLRATLGHKRDEEKKHAAMVLEWIRRHDPRFDAELKDYLFTSKSLAHD